MTTIPRKTIKASLLKKGFVKGKGDHSYYHHKYNGKITGAYTYVSTGSSYKEYDDNLFVRMKKELKLQRLSEVKKLLDCTMDGNDYNVKLREYGAISDS